ncbi:hypothetical protein HU200_011599 [Digitaria exilis]|uniref:Uncharacterized protein n=1 Tax=Digitaria exilis TaxID=1010633 RepID=A0A835KL81_9POAL|nr:hypothetical protein HU200_011599 [Digitaria exilis]
MKLRWHAQLGTGNATNHGWTGPMEDDATIQGYGNLQPAEQGSRAGHARYVLAFSIPSLVLQRKERGKATMGICCSKAKDDDDEQGGGFPGCTTTCSTTTSGPPPPPPCTPSKAGRAPTRTPWTLLAMSATTFP